MPNLAQQESERFWELCGVTKPACGRIGGCLHALFTLYDGKCACDNWKPPDPTDLNAVFEAVDAVSDDWEVGQFNGQYWCLLHRFKGKDAEAGKAHADVANGLAPAIFEAVLAAGGNDA